MKSFAWSYSALTRFETCPKQYYHMNVIKDVKDEGSQATREGQRIHEAMYKRVVKGTKLPLDLRHLEPTASMFASAPGEKYGEMKLAINRDFQQVGWFDKDVWLRTVVDLLVVRDDGSVIIIDWKTGKPKEDETQLALVSAAVACTNETLHTFRSAFVWVGDRKAPPDTLELKRENFPHVWNSLIPRANKIEQALKTTDFPAKPSGLCRGYCHVKSCPHWRERGT